MKTISVYMSLFISLMLVPVSVNAQIVLAAMEDFTPYSWVESGKQTGIDVEVIQLLSQKSGIPITVRLTPWKRVVHDTKSGRVDGAIAMFKSDEREGFAIFIPTPLHESTYKIFVRKGAEFKFDSVSDLYGKSIGQNAGFYISKAFEQANKEGLIRVKESTMEANIKRLNAKRIDSLVGNQQEVYYLLSQMGLSDSIVALPRPMFPSRGAYLAISKASQVPNKEQVVKKLSETLKAMKDSGELNEIYAKYGQK